MLRTAFLIVAFVLATGCGGGSTTLPPPDPPTIVSVDTTGDVGLPGTSVTFQAIVTGEVTSWEWSFSEEVFPRTSTDQSPTVDIVKAGTFSANLTVANAGGSSAPLGLQRLVQAPQAPSWSEIRVHLSFSGAFPFASFCVHADRIVVVHDRPNVGSVIAVALTNAPQAAADWAVYPLDMGKKITGQIVSSGGELLLLGSRPDDAQPGHFLGVFGRATEALPLAAEEWQMVDLAENLVLNEIIRLQSGWAGITFGDINDPVQFVATTVDEPTTSTDWHAFPLSLPGTIPGVSPRIVEVVDGILCGYIVQISDPDQIEFCASSVPVPQSIEDFTRYMLDTENEVRRFDMEIFRGTPVIAQQDAQVMGWLGRSEVALPVSSDQWLFSEIVTSDQLLFPNQGIDLAVAYDRLIITYGKEDSSIESSHIRQLDLGSFVGLTAKDNWQRQNAIGPSEPVYGCRTLPYENRLVTLYFDHFSGSPALAFSDGPW